MMKPFIRTICACLLTIFLFSQPNYTIAQCTPVGGASGTLTNSTGTNTINFTAALSPTCVLTNLGQFTGVCGISFPSITTPWSGNTNTVSTVTYTFSDSIYAIDILIGYTGINGQILPESFTFTTDNGIPSISVNSGFCTPWTINGNTTTSPNIVGGLNSVHTITSNTPFTTLAIATNSGTNGGSSYAICDSSLVTAGCSPTSSQLTVSACDTYTAPSGNVWTSSSVFTDTIPNSLGCDSLISINLTITTLDSTVLVSGGTLTANQSNATYQWLYCEGGFTPLQGETNQSFTPSQTGTYAVAISQNGCSDTSACFPVVVMGLDDLIDLPNLTAWPNPTEGFVNISLGTYYDLIKVRVINVLGQEISAREFQDAGEFEMSLTGTAGYYTVEIETSTGRKGWVKVVKR